MQYAKAQRFKYRFPFECLKKQDSGCEVWDSAAEFIAHAFENTYAGNDVFKKVLPELYKDMTELIIKSKPKQ